MSKLTVVFDLPEAWDEYAPDPNQKLRDIMYGRLDQDIKAAIITHPERHEVVAKLDQLESQKDVVDYILSLFNESK